jgi:hypothetical protein
MPCWCPCAVRPHDPVHVKHVHALLLHGRTIQPVSADTTCHLTQLSLQGTQVHLRPPQPLTHASLFATLKQFREQQHVRVDDEDLAHF